MIISIDAEKAFDKTQTSFLIKNFQQTRNRREIYLVKEVNQRTVQLTYLTVKN